MGHFGNVVKLERDNLTSNEVVNILLLSFWWGTTFHLELVELTFSFFGFVVCCLLCF